MSKISQKTRTFSLEQILPTRLFYSCKSMRLIIVLICTLCFGCKTISTSTININSEVPSRDIKTMAVMRFDDKRLQEEGVEGFIVQSIPNPDAGKMLADMFTNELLKWNKCLIITRSEVRGKIKAGGAKEEDLVNRKDYTALGKILKVDAVVLGKIHDFGLSNMAVYERGKVSFSAECIDTKNGKTLWSVEISKSAPYKTEVELAKKVIKELVEKLKNEIE